MDTSQSSRVACDVFINPSMCIFSDFQWYEKFNQLVIQVIFQ